MLWSSWRRVRALLLTLTRGGRDPRPRAVVSDHRRAWGGHPTTSRPQPRAPGDRCRIDPVSNPGSGGRPSAARTAGTAEESQTQRSERHDSRFELPAHCLEDPHLEAQPVIPAAWTAPVHGFGMVAGVQIVIAQDDDRDFRQRPRPPTGRRLRHHLQARIIVHRR